MYKGSNSLADIFRLNDMDLRPVEPNDFWSTFNLVDLQETNDSVYTVTATELVRNINDTNTASNI